MFDTKETMQIWLKEYQGETRTENQKDWPNKPTEDFRHYAKSYITVSVKVT